MDGNPVREGPGGYLIHELDGVEYGSIWSWAHAVLAKYGFSFEYAMCDWCTDEPPTLLGEGDQPFREVNCVQVFHWGELVTEHRYSTWDEYHQGLIDFACTLNSKGIVIHKPGATSASNTTHWIQYTPAAPDDPAFQAKAAR